MHSTGKALECYRGGAVVTPKPYWRRKSRSRLKRSELLYHAERLLSFLLTVTTQISHESRFRNKYIHTWNPKQHVTYIDLSLPSHQKCSTYPETRKRGIIIQEETSKTTTKQKKKKTTKKSKVVWKINSFMAIALQKLCRSPWPYSRWAENSTIVFTLLIS